ncbi:polysaccharide deacetylase family protein [Paenibacillus sp. 481]|nr:polysaccharide deacetylase family protein [Paenibacillus sp. 481]
MRQLLICLIAFCMLLSTGCFPHSRVTSPEPPTSEQHSVPVKTTGNVSPWTNGAATTWPPHQSGPDTGTPDLGILPKSAQQHVNRDEAKQHSITRKDKQADRKKETIRFTLHADGNTKQEKWTSRTKTAKVHTAQSTQSARSAQSRKSQSKQQQFKLSLAQLRMKYPHFFKLRGSASGKQKVALTFDDVPDHIITPLVLDILKEHHIQATFFLVGSRVKQYPQIVRRMVDEGHMIGNHSMSHPLLTKLSMPAFTTQVLNTEHIIEQVIGYKPRFFRPPYGAINEEQLRWAGKHGYIVVNWDVDSKDWKGLSGAEIEQLVMSNVEPGSIVLQHAGGSPQNGYLRGTLLALPRIIKKLQAKGYDFVTVPDLFHDQKEKKES